MQELFVQKILQRFVCNFEHNHIARLACFYEHNHITRLACFHKHNHIARLACYLSTITLQSFVGNYRKGSRSLEHILLKGKFITNYFKKLTFFYSCNGEIPLSSSLSPVSEQSGGSFSRNHILHNSFALKVCKFFFFFFFFQRRGPIRLYIIFSQVPVSISTNLL